ncbi:MAG: hypothetical protein ACRENS_05075 [Candidatus Eiseniibacteriota bacterium]
MHGDGRGVLAEALVSWMSLYGVLIALRVYAKQATRTRLELCVMFLLECLAALLAVRGFFWMTHRAAFGIATFAVASLIPLAVLLYVEALLRRHFPLMAKAFVLIGSAFFFGLAVSGNLHANSTWLPGFTAYILSMQLLLTGAILFRDQSDLSPVENRSLGAISVAVVLIVPFVATDLAADLGLNMVRVGSVGFLLFVHATVVASEPRGSARTVLREHLSVLITAAGLGAMLAYVVNDLRPATAARSASFFACSLLLVMIYNRVRSNRALARETGVARSVADANTSSTEEFIRVLDRLPMVAGYRLLRESDLKAYDHWSLPGVFHARSTHVVARNQLKRALRDRPLDPAYHAEQLEELMERDGMTHAVLICERPIVLLLVRIPSAGLEQAASAQLGLVRTVAEAIERSRAHA